MKKVFLVSVVALLSLGTLSWGLNFSPTLLKVNAPTQIKYNFDGSNVTIPVTVSGKPCVALFTVYTHGQANKIKAIKNGYLGWHYVNNIDTCVYAGSPKQLDVGTNNLTWNGKSTHQWGTDNYAPVRTDGEVVKPGDYTYYVYAYDGVGAKQLVSKGLEFGWMDRSVFKTKGTDGQPLANPIIVRNVRASDDKLTAHTNQKWVVGNDPNESTLIETCTTMDYTYGHGMDLDPQDFGIFYNLTYDKKAEAFVKKLKWVPNGSAEVVSDWGVNGECRYPVPTMGFEMFCGVISDGGDYLFTTDCDFWGTLVQSNLIVIDKDQGTIVRKLDLTNFWADPQADIKNKDGWAAEGPSQFHLINGKMALGTWWSYQLGMINPYAEDPADAHYWFNGNGDGWADMLHEANSTWEYKYTTQMDANYFQVSSAYDKGAVSYIMFGPDGTGLGFMAFAGETAQMKYGEYFVDYGSQFDGMYVDNASSADASTTGGWWYIGHDSFKGVISISDTAVGVNGASPAAFTVAQNSPNPFNPTTTISFTLAKAGKDHGRGLQRGRTEESAPW